MNIEQACKEALERINASIDKSYRKAVEKNHIRFKGVQQVTIEFRDRDQFYNIVRWLNRHVGHGHWSSIGRILRFIDPARTAFNPPIVRIITVNSVIDLCPIKQM